LREKGGESKTERAENLNSGLCKSSRKFRGGIIGVPSKTNGHETTINKVLKGTVAGKETDDCEVSEKKRARLACSSGYGKIEQSHTE